MDERLDRLVFGVVAEGYGDLGLERGVVWSVVQGILGH